MNASTDHGAWANQNPGATTRSPADLEREGLAMRSVMLTPDRLAGTDLVVIITAHKNIDYDMLLEHTQAVLDTRNALKGRNSPKIRRL